MELHRGIYPKRVCIVPNFAREFTNIRRSAFDGKAKVWSTETKACVATHSETDKALYAVKWIPKGPGIGEGFVTAGANRRICFYREATGGVE